MLRTFLRAVAGPAVLLAALLTALRVVGTRVLAADHAAAFVALTLGGLALGAVVFGVVLRRAGARWVAACAVVNAAATALYLGAWAAQRAAGWAAGPADVSPSPLPSLLLIALSAPGGVMFASGVRAAMLRARVLEPPPPRASATTRRAT